METIQNRIKNLVEAYKIAFPEEYSNVVKAVEESRRLQNDDFASADHTGSQVVGRAIHQIPQTLSVMFFRELNEEELEFYKSTNGARWFAKTFPEFAMPEKI